MSNTIYVSFAIGYTYNCTAVKNVYQIRSYILYLIVSEFCLYAFATHFHSPFIFSIRRISVKSTRPPHFSSRTNCSIEPCSSLPSRYPKSTASSMNTIHEYISSKEISFSLYSLLNSIRFFLKPAFEKM